jgi:hypothetical protein
VKAGDLVKIIRPFYLGAGIKIKYGILVKELGEEDEEYFDVGHSRLYEMQHHGHVDGHLLNTRSSRALWQILCDMGFEVHGDWDLEIVK